MPGIWLHMPHPLFSVWRADSLTRMHLIGFSPCLCTCFQFRSHLYLIIIRRTDNYILHKYRTKTNFFQVDNKLHVVRNTLRLPNVARRDHGARLTCRASNTNLTSPLATSVKINMVCEYPTNDVHIQHMPWVESRFVVLDHPA